LRGDNQKAAESWLLTRAEFASVGDQRQPGRLVHRRCPQWG